MSPNTSVYNKRLLPGEIRLLTLYPSILPSRTRCSLASVPLDDNTPAYEALSYCWGSLTNDEIITLNQEAFPITKCLGGALLALRLRNKARILWVDALCINQHDVTERSQQVQVMGDIYKAAERVVVWLRKSGNGSRIAMQSIAKLPPNPLADVALGICRDERLGQPVLNLLRRPWWSRAWIVQEVALAKNVVLVCGGDVLDWAKLAAFVEAVFLHPDVDVHVSQAFYRPLMLCQYREFSHRPILTTLRSLQRQQATDPRDKIYGFLGIVSEAERRLIVPDYHLSVKEVYVNATHSIIRATSSLSILSSVDVNNPSEDFPSWLYDLRQSDPTHLPMADSVIKHYHASGNSTPIVGALEGVDVLDVNGFVWDEITELGILCNENDHTVTNPYGTLITQWLELLQTTQPMENEYVGGKTQDNAFWRTMMIDRAQAPNSSDFRRATPEDVTIFRVTCSHMIRVQPTPAFMKDFLFVKYRLQENPDFYSNLFAKQLSRLHSWRLFRTRKGFIGLCCNAAQIGDKVCVLLGGEVPFVLRQELDCHRFLGECYVHGIMDGEAMSALENEDEPSLETFHLR